MKRKTTLTFVSRFFEIQITNLFGRVRGHMIFEAWAGYRSGALQRSGIGWKTFPRWMFRRPE
jgi:hypothetical protein